MLILLFGAGFETTMHMIGNALFTLLSHPDQLQHVRDDRSLVASALEETIRYEGITQRIGRQALEPTSVGGVALDQGEWVLAILGSANRDPAAFPDAERFDVARQPNEHLGFAGGIRYCLGASLARMEMACLFERLIDRFPTIELLDPVPHWQHRFIVRGLDRLDVTFKA